MQFGDEKEAKLMKIVIGICTLGRKRCKTDEKCYKYTEFGDGKEAKLTNSPICICSLVVKKRQN